MIQPVYDRAGIRLYHNRWEDIAPSIDPASVDCAILDPPYGFGLETWDTKPDMDALCAELTRLQPEYVSFFCQMPFLLDVAASAKQERWHYCEHVAWVKRNTTPSARLSRSHESVLIYAPGKSRKFYTTRGPYEDVRVPGVLVDTVSLEGVMRQIGFFRQQIKTGRNPSSQTGDCRTISRFTDRDRKRIEDTTNYTNVWSFLPPNNKKRPGFAKLSHVSMKPVPVCERLIEMTCTPGGTVVDFFAGSGTTGIAAANTGHPAILCEADERYIPVIIDRIDAALDANRQLALAVAD